MARAAGVVAMGGYNTFCEILSFDKPALIVPRTVPRLEQFIRASRAAGARAGPHAARRRHRDDPAGWRRRCAQLPQQPPPSRRWSSPACSTGSTSSTGWPMDAT